MKDISKMNNKMFRVDTVEQFKILEYINSQFTKNSLELELIDRCTIKCTDSRGDTVTFRYNQEEQCIEYD